MCVRICGRVSSLCAQCMHTMHVYVCMGVHECGLPRHVCIHKEVCLESLRTMYAYYARVGMHVCSWMCFYTACAYVQASVSRVSAHDVLYTMRIQVLVRVCVCMDVSWQGMCVCICGRVSSLRAQCMYTPCACRCACEYTDVFWHAVYMYVCIRECVSMMYAYTPCACKCASMPARYVRMHTCECVSSLRAQYMYTPCACRCACEHMQVC